LHPYIICSCYKCVIPMNIGVVCLFTSSPMELITFNVTKCLQLASLLWTWSCTSLLLLLILWLGTKFDGHAMKICWMWWLVFKIGVASFLFKVQLTTHIFTFKNLKKFILQIFFLTNPKLTTCNRKKLLIMINSFKIFLWDCQDEWSKVMQLSSFYKKATFEGFFDLEHGSHDVIHPHIIEDKG